MPAVEILDLVDLPSDQPIWIYGAGEQGETLLSHLRALGQSKVHGFFDSFKAGSRAGLDVLHPKTFEGEPGGVTVVLATLDRANVEPLLENLGFRSVFRANLFLQAIEAQGNIHYLPDTLANGEPTRPISFEEGRIRAAGGRLLIQHKDLATGFCRLRRLALESGIIHVEDDIAGCAFRQAGDQKTLVSFYDEAVRKGILPGKALAEKQAEAMAKGLPPVFINTMLKSGTGFLTKVLREHLDLPQYFTTLRGSPNDWILPGYMEKFAAGGALTVQHLDAGEANLDLLAAKGIAKIYLHIRDPRQATVSYMHHLENNLSGELFALRNWIQPFLPADYIQMDWRQKTAWQAKNHVPGLIHWTQEWVTAAERDSRFDIMIVDFDEFRRDEVATINKILSFFGIDYQVSEADMPHKKDVPHFRKGKTEEWREVFTARQQEIHWQLIPKPLATRFGWRE